MKYVIFLVIFTALVYLIRFAIRNLEFIIVSGDSMFPTLHDGQVVLLYKTDKIKVGDIVIATDTSKCPRTMIKRVLSIRYIGGEYRYWIEGDNKDNSFDSRNYGHIRKNAIEGKIIRWKKNK